ncbi:MAG: AAA family ATPase [Treponema sp. CETP13]|nr:MAG: AAA family ATPase [Treponema sp. CETP13]
MVGKIPENEALGESPAFLNFQEQLSCVAKVERPVLLIGERGSGKELAASRLHYLSNRWASPFLALNCSALPENLIESELFGYAPGAFTGANTQHKGRFEEANGGTLLLDELALIPINVQEKILRVVEYGCFERVGSSKTIEVDVRLVGATNGNLQKLCDEGKFKRDLLDRLSFEVLFLPPLRERKSDILGLAQHFAARMTSELSDIQSELTVPHFSKQAELQLLSYSWPGNIRELKNTVERAVYKCKNGIIDKVELNPFNNPFALEKATYTKSNGSSNNLESKLVFDLSHFEEDRRKLEIDYLKEALKQSGGSQKKAASALNISYDSFRGMYRKYKDSFDIKKSH